MLRKRATKWDREIVLIRKGENNRDRKRERERRVYKERKRRSIYRERVLIEKSEIEDEKVGEKEKTIYRKLIVKEKEQIRLSGFYKKTRWITEEQIKNKK